MYTDQHNIYQPRSHMPHCENTKIHAKWSSLGIDVKDNQAISQISQKPKYLNVHERCLTILFGLFRNEVKSHASLLFLEI